MQEHKRCKFDPWVRKISLEEGMATMCSGQENPTDKGAAWATVHSVAKNQTQLKRLSTHAPSTEPGTW